jgi:hypothetical protein
VQKQFPNSLQLSSPLQAARDGNGDGLGSLRTRSIPSILGSLGERVEILLIV